MSYHIDYGETFSASGSGLTNHTIGNTSDGNEPKYILLTCGGTAGVQVAIGGSSTSAATDPQFFMVAGQNPICLNVSAMTRISIQNDDAGAQDIYVAYLGNY